MAESFLEPIFKYALLIYDFEECVHLLHIGNLFEARKKYNSAIEIVEKILPELNSISNKLANDIFRYGEKISTNWNNPSLASGLITNSLIPLLFSYMSHFSTIDVSEGKYVIKSADSGFLTLTDTELGITFHDVHDPMKEASDLTDYIYSPTNKEVHILGCDLGYLPYMLYRKSLLATKIYIYENEPEIINYAKQFGTLSWIPDDNLEIILISEPLSLSKAFLEHLNMHESDILSKTISYYITPWKAKSFDQLGLDYIKKQSEILSFNRNKSTLCTVNMLKNYSAKKIIPFNEIKQKISSQEWVVIAAGPSFDDSLSFIRQSQGKRKIVAVNTVVRRLQQENISADLIVAADPRPALLKHIDGCEDYTNNIPLIADETTYWNYIDKYQGRICFVPTPNGLGLPLSNPLCENIWPISGTVVTLAIESALRLSAKTIFLVGLDLAYPGGANYAHGMPHERTDQKIGDFKVMSVEGKLIESCQAFDMFRLIIENQIQNHPDVRFINLSKHGALIKGTSNYYFLK